MAARVPYVKREELDAEGQEIYDRIRRDRNAPEVGLQFRALLNSPKATSCLTSLGAELRFRNAMPADLTGARDHHTRARMEQRHRVDRAQRARREGRR